MSDRGVSLTATQGQSAQGVVAVIGEMVSRNSVTTALISSISKMINCNAHAVTTALSNKGDYLYTIRGGDYSIHKIPQHHFLCATDDEATFSLFLVLSSSKRFFQSGQSILQELGTRAKANNMTIKGFIQFPPGKRNYTSEIKAVLAFKPQTIVLQAALADGVRLMTSANSMGLFNGDIFWVLSNGFAPMFFTLPDELEALSNMQGIWQVHGRLGQVGEFSVFEKDWYRSFNPDGSIIINGTGSSCDLSVPFARGCMGSGSGIVGALPEIMKAARMNNYFLPYSATMGCIEIIAKSFDYHGDSNIEVAVTNYFYSKERKSVWIHEVGYWEITTDTIKLTTSDIYYLGNRTGRPMPPATLTNEFKANLALRYSFDGIVAFCSAISLALTATVGFYYKKRIFKASSPIFLVL
ncbi:hypothetical protein HDU97_000144 [Phlyctochytrium planicorne]|nr:hypothetical protein HDU97_000144 [Phlyctochytrium planicorne]